MNRAKESTNHQPERERPAVLFPCTGNSCRSRMAEGWLRHLAGDRYEALSAGLEPRTIHPLAIAVMKDAGIDIGAQRSKSVRGLLGRKSVRCAVFVCAKAEMNCPTTYPFAVERLSWPFEDPVAFQGTDEERHARFREVRDRIQDRILEWLNPRDRDDSTGNEAPLKNKERSS